MKLKSVLRFVFNGLVLALTAITIFVTTQAVLAQPPENATAYLRLF
jgi:hypothetical protein